MTGDKTETAKVKGDKDKKAVPANVTREQAHSRTSLTNPSSRTFMHHFQKCYCVIVFMHHLRLISSSGTAFTCTQVYCYASNAWTTVRSGKLLRVNAKKNYRKCFQEDSIPLFSPAADQAGAELTAFSWCTGSRTSSSSSATPGSNVR